MISTSGNCTPFDGGAAPCVASAGGVVVTGGVAVSGGTMAAGGVAAGEVDVAAGEAGAAAGGVGGVTGVVAGTGAVVAGDVDPGSCATAGTIIAVRPTATAPAAARYRFILSFPKTLAPTGLSSPAPARTAENATPIESMRRSGKLPTQTSVNPRPNGNFS